MNERLSTRLDKIRPSGVRRIFDIACANPDGIDLSIGDPDFDVPNPIKAAAVESIRKGQNGYVSTRGIPELREKLAANLSSRGLHFDDLLITSGATGGYYLAILALVSPGDEVLIIDPFFVAYGNVVLMHGGIPKLIDTYPDFRLTEKAIVSQITERTKAIVLNNPGNPTGIVYGIDELHLVADIAKAHNLRIIADEIYDEFVFSDEPFVSIGNIAEDALVIGGFSKTAGMTGWRLGYASGPGPLIDAMATLQQYSYVCANSVAQWAALAALDFDISPYVARFKARRDKLYEGLKDNFKMYKPEGAFYLFPEAPGGSAGRFVNAAIERKVFIIPGNVFSTRDTHMRISMVASDDKLDRAIDILNDIAASFK